MFRPRPFFSFLLAISFLIAAFSGLALYLRPEGSIARWIGWHFLGVGKSTWESIHTIMVVLMLASVAGHLRFNWQTLLRYTKKSGGAIKGSLRELSLALVCILVCAALAWYRLPPASWLIDLRSDIKNGMCVLHTAPPVTDADLLTIAEISKLMDQPSSILLGRLAEAGIASDSVMTIGKIARSSDLTPEEIFRILDAR